MRVAVAVSLLALAGCVTAPAVDPNYKLRPQTRSECAAHCEQLGMQLGAVVLIRNSAGCVCEPRGAPAPQSAVQPGPGGGSAVAGGALVLALEEEARQQHQQHQQQSSRAGAFGAPGTRR